jgi:hypothetical protein
MFLFTRDSLAFSFSLLKLNFFLVFSSLEEGEG